MNYQKAIIRLGVLVIDGKAIRAFKRGGKVDEAITLLRAYAIFGKGPMAGRGVKRRVAKKWSVRLLREGLPRTARMTGPWRRR
jgi:hypothetical protein